MSYKYRVEPFEPGIGGLVQRIGALLSGGKILGNGFEIAAQSETAAANKAAKMYPLAWMMVLGVPSLICAGTLYGIATFFPSVLEQRHSSNFPTPTATVRLNQTPTLTATSTRTPNPSPTLNANSKATATALGTSFP